MKPFESGFALTVRMKESVTIPPVNPSEIVIVIVYVPIDP